MTQIDVGIVGERVSGFLFYPDGIRIMLMHRGAYLASGGIWHLTWPDGATYDFKAEYGIGEDPATGRLLGTLIPSGVTAAYSDARSTLHVEFDSGLQIDFIPQFDDYDYWEVYSPKGIHTMAGVGSEPLQQARPRPDQIGLEGNVEAIAIEEPRKDERLIDLEISDRVYGVTVLAESLQLETRSGSIFFAGAIRLTDSTGSVGEFDPRYAGDGPSLASVLKLLIDNTITTAALAPDSSRLVVEFVDGLRLLWQAPSAQQGVFRARGADKREFWSRGDGTVYWFGGTEGTTPTFLVGGPKGTE